MTRRTLLIALAAVPAFAEDAAAQVWDVLSDMASALSAGDAPRFLHAFDRSTKGYEDLRVAVTGLVAEAEIASAIDPVENTGDEQNRTLEVAWSLRLTGRSELRTVADRQANVMVRLTRERGKWKVTGFAAGDLFRPLSARM